MDNKHITKQYLTTYIKGKGLDEKQAQVLVQDLVGHGYTIEGYNEPDSALSKVAKFGQNLIGQTIQPFESVAKTAGSLGSAAISSGVNALGGNIGGGSKNFQSEYQRARDINNQVVSPTKAISGGEVSAPARDVTTSQGVEQTLGDIGQGALNVATLGEGSAALSGVKAGIKPVVENIANVGYKQAIKTGAALGAGYGATSAMQEGKGFIDTTKQAAGGALLGAGLGLAGEGIAQGISKAGKISSEVQGVKNTKANNFALDLVSPKPTEAVKIQALKEGRVSEQGLLNASKILPSKRDIQLADTVKGIVSPKKSATQNLDLIGNKVDEINTGVKAFVKANKSPFNTKQLTSQLNQGKGELNLIFAGDKQAEKTYNAVVKEFVKNVKNKDTYGLLEARQTFDNIPAIKKLLSSQGLGENVKKEIVLTVRGKANEYVASLLPKGNKFREALLNEHKMLEAMQNIAEKNTKEIGVNKLQSLTQKYPILKAIAGGLATGIGLGGIGVGASVIGSSD